ncbi:MAG: hypothetical protein J6M18_00495 [Actinomycetaceae bacterium]|nr:hypothetical protein [Actinomycetaceae bacterium]
MKKTMTILAAGVLAVSLSSCSKDGANISEDQIKAGVEKIVHNAESTKDLFDFEVDASQQDEWKKAQESYYTCMSGHLISGLSDSGKQAVADGKKDSLSDDADKQTWKKAEESCDKILFDYQSTVK